MIKAELPRGRQFNMKISLEMTGNPATVGQEYLGYVATYTLKIAT